MLKSRFAQYRCSVGDRRCQLYVSEWNVRIVHGSAICQLHSPCGRWTSVDFTFCVQWNYSFHLLINSVIFHNLSKILPEAHGPSADVDLRIFRSQPDATSLCKAMDTGRYIAWCVCLFTPHNLLVLTAPTQEGTTRLSWPGRPFIYGNFYTCLRTVTRIITLSY